MDNTYDYNDWLDGSGAFDYGTPEVPTGSPGGGTAAEQASPAPDRVDQPSGEDVLPLLRLGAWNSDQQYDKNNPICIHYDFRWKVSHRQNTRARNVYSDTDPDLVLAPSDFWKVNFEARLESMLKDEDKFPGESYTCEETIIEISIERTRQRGLRKQCKNLDIDWQLVNNHLEGLSDLFRRGRKIIFSMEFFYKEVTHESTTVKGKAKRRTATEAQRQQRAAEAGLWGRVYERWHCRAVHCKQGPHCWLDERGNHHAVLPAHLADVISHIKGNMKEGEKEEDVDVDIEMPRSIVNDILDNSRKRKANGSIDCKLHAPAHRRCCDATAGEDPGDVKGDRQVKLEEYCNWTLTQVARSDRWRSALQVANQVALDQFLELNTIRQHPKIVVELMVKNGVRPGVALQFVSNIKKFQQEQEKAPEA